MSKRPAIVGDIFTCAASTTVSSVAVPELPTRTGRLVSENGRYVTRHARPSSGAPLMPPIVAVGEDGGVVEAPVVSPSGHEESS